MPNRSRRSNSSTNLSETGRALIEFLKTEGGGGVVLLAASTVALVWANSPWQDTYHDLWHHEVTVGPAAWALKETLQHWVNDAFMALFFLSSGWRSSGSWCVANCRRRAPPPSLSSQLSAV